MASKKPVIHGRDHLVGGSDPIPNLVTTASALNPQFGYYDTDGLLFIEPENNIDSWHYHSDTALLDLTDPTTPTFITRGVYGVTGTVSFGSGWSAGTFPFGSLIFNPGAGWTTDFYFQSHPHSGFSTFPPPISFASTFQAEVGSSMQLQYSNFDGSTQHAFSATQIRVQLIGTF